MVLADDKKTVLEIHVEYDREKKTKPKVSCISMLSSILLGFSRQVSGSFT